MMEKFKAWILALSKSKIVVSATKNAVNAIFTNAALMTMMSGAFNLHSSDGWWNVAKLTASVVASREAIVWVPKIVAWSTTNGNNS